MKKSAFIKFKQYTYAYNITHAHLCYYVTGINLNMCAMFWNTGQVTDNIIAEIESRSTIIIFVLHLQETISSILIIFMNFICTS
jgi:hypothetical protein